MEEEMVEDTVNEEEVEYNFTAYEIDLEYEFDASRFFDFSRAESPLEARQAELWFDSAGSYPPSRVESMNLCEGDSDVEVDREISAMGTQYGDGEGQDKETSSTVHIGSQQKFQDHSHKLPSGLTFYNHMEKNVNSQNQTKLSMKPACPRTSTLMKPTASQLAKQNRPFQAGYSRSHTSVLDKTSKSSASTSVIENQAAKRQKLEGGLLRKPHSGSLKCSLMRITEDYNSKQVAGTVQLQQTNFVHKVPQREGFLDGSSRAKPRITIPRDPDLETAQRAQRTRTKSSKEETVTSTVRRFKALPLNRKILEAPSLLPKRSTPRLPDFQEFHLKTSERAMQHSSAVLKSTFLCNLSDKELPKCTTNLTIDHGNREPGRPSLMNNASRPDGCQSSHSFKALPLNKKILTSKGDLGIFRNNKKETTVPMEFNFQTDKRFHNNLPIELFNKLSLASETQPVANSESKVTGPISTLTKGSKENRWACFQQGNEIKQPAKLKLPPFGGKQQPSADEGKDELSTASGISWSTSKPQAITNRAVPHTPNPKTMATRGFLIAIIIAAVAAPAFATDYVVGDNAGWKLGVNYTAWAEGKDFFVGDRLIFQYGQGAHNVQRVNGTAFQQCMVPSPPEALTTGNDVITLATPGRKWYICGVGNHCASGMKLVINVASAEAPAMAPAPSTATSAAANHQKSPVGSCVWIIAALAMLMLI
ncbi:UNVERIFIED_CONTAM: protein TPX2 [Sesamum calycinum]|uniref:Protein TPX2 n=1 Tax=Sesamum calycinum TaxID=2727403 RepID=A0AAW2M1U8_9LAMI